MADDLPPLSPSSSVLETAARYLAGGRTTQTALSVWRSTLRTAIEDDGACEIVDDMQSAA
jgi:hypothetical protein